MLLLSLPAGLKVDWSGVPLAIWAGLLWAVVLSAFAGWIVWGWVNAVRGVARTAPLMYLMPPVAGLVAWWVTGEGYGAIKLLGAAVTLTRRGNCPVRAARRSRAQCRKRGRGRLTQPPRHRPARESAQRRRTFLLQRGARPSTP